MKTILITTAIFIASAISPAWAIFPIWSKKCTDITRDEVIAAQKKWGDAIVAIGKADDPVATASSYLDMLYSYHKGQVLFKPTLAADRQFRASKGQALSYFVKGIVPEDKGFALKPYIRVRFENNGIISDCDSALAMGNYYFTTTNGKETKVEYSFGYVKDKEGKLKINLHHSSLPYKK